MGYDFDSIETDEDALAAHLWETCEGLSLIRATRAYEAFGMEFMEFYSAYEAYAKAYRKIRPLDRKAIRDAARRQWEG